MAEALALIERAEQHPSGRLFGMVTPSQIDTCTEGLLRDSFAEATARGVSWQIHAAQSVSEFHEITRRHGFTPIGWLDHLGLLSPRTVDRARHLPRRPPLDALAHGDRSGAAG